MENTIYSINGPVVTIKGKTDLEMMEMVYVGKARLVGEVIRMNDKETTIQVYEETGGLKAGEPVESTGGPLSVTLGPGILRNIYDGIQRPLEKIVEKRVGKQGIGFENTVQSKADKASTSELLKQVQPHDLLKFGIIPELVGRLPVISPLEALTWDELVRILTEPKNALVKQYKALLAYDGVALEFQQGALEAVADKAIERNFGARGLRAVMEGMLTKVMYDIPSDPTITKVTITADCVNGAEPVVERDPEKATRKAKLKTGAAEKQTAPAS